MINTATRTIAVRLDNLELAGCSLVTCPSTMASHSGHANASSQISAPHSGQKPVSEENLAISSDEGSSCMKMQSLLDCGYPLGIHERQGPNPQRQ